jgi:riboflavin biosynthesis pyrimidine reductase
LKELQPLETLYQRDEGAAIPLPLPLSEMYGELRLPAHPSRPSILANFATTLDGVVSLGSPGAGSGGEITGSSATDRMVMGLLRALADVVIVGAGTFRAFPNHRWTPAHIFPPLAAAYAELRRGLGRTSSPTLAIVSATGDIDLGRPQFTSGEQEVLILTTPEGARRLEDRGPPRSVQLLPVPPSGQIPARSIIDGVHRARPGGTILVEGGPHLIGDLFGERLVSELFLTLAPQIAGRSSDRRGLGLVEGRTFAPEDPLWGALSGVKRAGDLLFLRFSFASP